MPSILDDLITAYDEDPDSRKIAEAPPQDLVHLIARESAESIRIQQFTDDRANRRSRRSYNKQLKDQAHGEKWNERQRVFKEAHHDVLRSPGEVDSRSSSKILGIEVAGKFEGLAPGDVLKDPKLRNATNGYVYSALRR